MLKNKTLKYTATSTTAPFVCSCANSNSIHLINLVSHCVIINLAKKMVIIL